MIIPAFNAEAFLAEALDSALSQTLPPFEVIVVDDGSRDQTAEVARRYGDRIHFLQQPNSGVAAARNAAMERASGDWLAFLDADDIWERNKLERLSPLLAERPAPTVVFSDYRSFGTEEATHHPSAGLAAWNANKDVLVPLVSVMPSAALVPRGYAVRFPEWARNDEDAIFFNEMSDRGRVVCLGEPLMRYRKHPSQAQAQVVASPVGSANLLRWAIERELTYPGTVARLFHTLSTLVVTARWKRDWVQYWTLRNFCDEHWPADSARADVLSERVLPPALYMAKDWLDRLRGGCAQQRSAQH